MSKKKKKKFKLQVAQPENIKVPVLDNKVKAWNDEQIAKIKRKTEPRQLLRPPMPPQVTPSRPISTPSSAIVTELTSDFDGECEEFINRLIGPFPIELQSCEFGMGLFASAPIKRWSKVLVEEPSYQVKQSTMDILESAVEQQGELVAISNNSVIVAGIVEEVLSSQHFPNKMSAYLPLRCLGSIPKQTEAEETAFFLIGKAFQLPDSLWTREVCSLIHRKVSTNAIDDHLYMAASMINHSCIANVAWSPADPLRTLIALRDIHPGEQIFYSYAHVDDARKRRAVLLENFGFHCTCESCRRAGLA